MTARQEKVREALNWAGYDTAPPDAYAAALAEVEEWETRMAESFEARDALIHFGGKWQARAEAAEAELQHFRDCADTPLMRDVLADRDEARRELAERDGTVERWQQSAALAEAEADRLKAALEQIASKRCLNVTANNPDGSCDWPCVVCVARAALVPADRNTT